VKKYTRKHIRNFRPPSFLRQQGPAVKHRDPREIVFDEFKHIAAIHHPPLLPDDLLAELDHVIDAVKIEAENIFRD
jgi:hypothetical protein